VAVFDEAFGRAGVVLLRLQVLHARDGEVGVEGSDQGEGWG